MPRFIWFDPIPAGVTQTVTRTYVTSYIDTSAGTTYSFPASSIGTAVAGRVVAVGITAESTGGNSIAVSSGTIGGNPASVTATTNTKNGAAGIIALVVGSGTTATITVTFSNAVNGCAIHVYALYGASSATAYDTDTMTSQAATTINIPAGGVALGIGYNETQDVTWTVTGMSEDGHANFDTTAYCAASVESLIGGSGVSVRLLPSAVLRTKQAFASFSG
jgi:hypothetical protein